MHLCYFDENKHGPDSPHFFIGGLLIPDIKALDFENTLNQIAFNFFGARSLTQANEFHGKELFHGKGNAKGRKLEDRVQVFQDVATFVTNNQIPVRMVCIDVERHKNKYQYPMPAYRLGLMLILGWKARLAAAGLAVFVAVITPIFHNFWAMPAAQQMMQQQAFFKNFAIVGGLLVVVAFGAGGWSLDGRRGDAYATGARKPA